VTATDCQWASCSLSFSVEALLKIKGLRRRNRYVAALSIPLGAGLSLVSKQHVDFWRFENFDISTAVKAVEGHGLT
jgi:hypothetical protein